MDIILTRTSYLKEGTTGQILDSEGRPICLTLERPWENNEPNVSCVPTGIYGMELDMRHPGTKNEYLVWELRGVEGRSQIQIHPGNKVSHSLGCILPASTLTAKGENLFGASSRTAFKTFMAKMGEEKTKAEIMIIDEPYRGV
jgi:hypothetical protein